MALKLKESYTVSHKDDTFEADEQGSLIARETLINGKTIRFTVREFKVTAKGLSLVIIKENKNELGFWEKQGSSIADSAGPNHLVDAAGNRAKLEDEFDLVPDTNNPVLEGLGTPKKDGDDNPVYRDKKVMKSGYKTRMAAFIAKDKPLNTNILAELDSYLSSIYSK